jgi:hypothetical protein
MATMKPKKQMPANKGETGGGVRGAGTGASKAKAPKPKEAKLTGTAKQIMDSLNSGFTMKSSTGKVTQIKPKKKGM